MQYTMERGKTPPNAASDIVMQRAELFPRPKGAGRGAALQSFARRNDGIILHDPQGAKT